MNAPLSAARLQLMCVANLYVTAAAAIAAVGVT
jgi:hypothetical protein